MGSSDGTHDHLLTRARGGDDGALGALLEQYRAYLTLIARLELGPRLQGKAEPGDLVQEAFLEAARNFATFRGSSEAELAAWLRQILAGCLTHLLRRYFGTGARDVRLERPLGDGSAASSAGVDPGLVARQSSPSQRASRREEAVRLADALEALPAVYREVIVLRHLEGLSFPEVARRMGRTVDSVEKLWVRGLARLKQVLGTDV